MDRMETLLKGRHPIDVILLFAAEEGDTPKIGENPIRCAGIHDPEVQYHPRRHEFQLTLDLSQPRFSRLEQTLR